MELVKKHTLATPDLEAPVLIEGLPGAGLVGTLAANHIVEEGEGQPVVEIYSDYFPPNVSVDENRTVSLDAITISAVETETSDLLVLTGGVQAEDTVGQHQLTEAILDIADEFGVEDIFTLGGVYMKDHFEERRVIGVVTEGSSHLKETLRQAGVSFEGKPDPDAIGGISGLLLGAGAQRGFSGAGLIGTTTGFQIDPKSARIVLEPLLETLEFSMDLTPLSDQPEEKKASVRQIQKKLELDLLDKNDDDDSLRYLG